MTIWQKNISLEAVNERGQNTMMSHCGIQITEIGDEHMLATMPVDERTRQPLGIMHGGASCVLAETVGSVAANFAVDDMHYCVGLSINTSHIRSAKPGTVTGRAIAKHLGRSTQVWQIDIRNEKQQIISSTQLTMMVLPK